MKKKNILIVFICIAFVTIVCLSCISAFSIARIEITFAAVKDSSPAYFKEVKEDLDSVIGKSLLFSIGKRSMRSSAGTPISN